jgi:hypothetical protein
MRFAFLSFGRLYLADSEGHETEVTSKFAQEALERGEQEKRRHGWKGGDDPGALIPRRVLWGKQTLRELQNGLRFCSLSAGGRANEIFYTLGGDGMGGLFEQDTAENSERRILHQADFEVHHIHRNPTKPLLAYSRYSKDGSASLWVRDLDQGKARELTEGDSVDDHPAWVRGGSDALVYQSAGIGRGQNNPFAALGPFRIERIDLATGEIETLAEDARFDLLVPHQMADGTLYFIRRPYEDPSKVSYLRAAGDFLLFPFRLVGALVAILNFFSKAFSGKPLVTAGRPELPGTDVKRLILLGRAIDADEELKRARKKENGAIVPSSWQLVSRSPDGTETVIAKSVASYDVSSDGRLVFSDGCRAYLRSETGATSVVIEHLPMERLVALD